jgi:hypothetical protein
MDELERRIRAARPLSGHRDLPLTDRAKRELAELMLAGSATESASARQSRGPRGILHPMSDVRRRAFTRRPANPRTTRSRAANRPRVLAGSLAASIAVVAVVALTLGDSPSATADGLPPLQFTPVDASIEEIIDDSQRHLAADTSGAADPLRFAASVGWYAQINGNAREDALTAINPVDRTTRWAEDLSGSITVTAGIPYTVDGTPVSPLAPEPGAVLWEETFAAGEITSIPPETPPATPAELRNSINAVAFGDATTGAADHIFGFESLLGWWTLTNAHHSALLDIIASDGDATVAGETTDRAGRAVIGIRATSHTTPWMDVIALISPTTGRVIGVETVYTGTGDEVAIPTGTVLSYTLWEESPD